MIDINLLRKQLPEVVARLKTRNFEFPEKEFSLLKMSVRRFSRRLKNCRLCVTPCPVRSDRPRSRANRQKI